MIYSYRAAATAAEKLSDDEGTCYCCVQTFSSLHVATFRSNYLFPWNCQVWGRKSPKSIRRNPLWLACSSMDADNGLYFF